MRAEQMAALPERPESVAEWEDLLVRLEIVPRVVRNGVEDAAGGEEAVRVLREAVEREAAVGAFLEAAAGLERAPVTRGAESRDDAEALGLRFASLRARSFAMVQRRGLEVWEWSASLPRGGSATVHQLLLWLAARDGELLADLRAAARTGPVGC